MAIDPVLKVWLISPAAGAEKVPEQLARIGLVHVAEVPRTDDEHQAALRSLSADTRAIEARVRKLAECLDILSQFHKTPRDLLSNLIPTPIETTHKKLEAALQAIDVESLHPRLKELAAQRAAAQAAAERAKGRLKTLEGFGGLDVAVPAEGGLRWSSAVLWLVPTKLAERLDAIGSTQEGVVLEALGEAGSNALVASVALREQADMAASRLRELGFEPVPGPERSTTLGAYVQAIREELRSSEAAAREVEAELASLGPLRTQVELVLGHEENALETARAVSKMAATGRAAVMVGYVRAREAEALKAAVAREMPEISLVLEPPAAGDNVPVSLTNKALFRPAQFLVEMFGLPSYHAFDPSAFLMLSFVLFFGICLGDAIYGLVMLAMCLALRARYREYPGLRNFFGLLCYGAVSTFLVGAATATAAADLPARVFGSQSVFANWPADPLKKPVAALGIALALGIANQFWGIAMKFRGLWLQGDKWGAVFDAGLWFLLLPGLVLLLVGQVSPELALAGTIGGWLAAAGAAGLVLTQGRNEKSVVGKVVVGLLSLYGIVGSYGCVSFIGDTLSYSRLLALGLTTTIVGMAVNIIAELVKLDIAVLGTVLFLVVMAGGHLFNLLISGLGAFIHAARLIFVEFFGRFYEPGAQRFAPLGATGSRIRITG
ncbi:MAG TPA: hypothetical protein PLE19_09535 [Planctomycetota bacterium]|nr:hypothetical protein [Planctomycetota bacterium]HRR79502.1 hypothetical protein [Planctomycetota bacterium]HRT95260.1 hypothetical protein [Planctomycetota bacterium]